MKRAAIIVAALAGTFTAHESHAQALYAGVRAGAASPTGAFSTSASGTEDPSLRGATAGAGYGLDAGVGSPLVGFYASYDRINFGCASGGACATSGKYKLSGVAGGVRVGIPLIPMIKPWAKAGITYNEITRTLNGTTSSTGKSPGYEVGAGVDIPVLLNFFSLTPQVRRIRQKLSLGGSKRSADYYTFDIGFRVRTPI